MDKFTTAGGPLSPCEASARPQEDGKDDQLATCRSKVRLAPVLAADTSTESIMNGMSWLAPDCGMSCNMGRSCGDIGSIMAKPTCATRLELAGDKDKEELECLSSRLASGSLGSIKGKPAEEVGTSSSLGRVDPGLPLELGFPSAWEKPPTARLLLPVASAMVAARANCCGSPVAPGGPVAGPEGPCRLVRPAGFSRGGVPSLIPPMFGKPPSCLKGLDIAGPMGPAIFEVKAGPVEGAA
mmetsp:Transcript_57084/g.90532  ORF Transcript_57084/g.90532 Transcript_57084/m.90532 type:complete len:240 (+) Transcript_57084:575-1294(+)